MSYNTTFQQKICLLVVLCVVLFSHPIYSQETSSEISSKSTYHNQLFFNRFLINPTFSLVRENKSYLNILHRNQYATFDDNSQNYFLGFSNRLNDHTAVGIGIYSQWSGVIQEFGFNANYATSVKLGEKSSLTFGTNVTYFNEGLDKNRIVATENDTKINEATKESKIAVQPGITLSIGKFDFGLYAEDLFKYNQTTNSFLTRLNDKSVTASLQYTHPFTATRGLFTDARLMPLLQMSKNEDGSLGYFGSILLDLPKYGWLQSTVDDAYGLSMGFGFNLSKKMSLGYLMEKDLFDETADFGWNHELSLAYTFKDEKTGFVDFADSSQDAKIDQIVRNYEEQILQLKAEKSKSVSRSNRKDSGALSIPEEESNSLAYQNRLILDELILRQDSIEKARDLAFEERFQTIVRILRSDIKQNIKVKSEEYNNPAKETMVAQVEKPKPPTTELNNKEQKGYEKLPIKVLNQSDIIGVKSGYYVIANVYKNKKYLNAFMKTLSDQGLEAKQFYNKENGLYYVYLADYNAKSEAEGAYVSNLNGKYNDEKWIMQVDNSMATAANIYDAQ